MNEKQKEKRCRRIRKKKHCQDCARNTVAYNWYCQEVLEGKV
jgi:hypothetical protein